MKFSSMRAFVKHLEGAGKAGFSSLYLIVSPEGSENRVAIDRLVEKIVRREGIEALGIRSLSQPSACEIDQEINTLNFFSSKKIVLVSGAEELSSEAQEVILRGGSTGHCFIVLHGLSGSNAFYKKVEKAGIVAELGTEKSWEKEKSAQEWVMQRMMEERKRIEPLAAQLLAKESGGEIGFLEQEIEKLVVYTLGRETITRQDVAAVSISRPSITVFQLFEAIFKRDAAAAIRYFRQLLGEGISYFAIVKQLRGQILTDLEIASILKMGGTSADVTQTFPYMKGFILEKHLETVRMWGFEGLKRALVFVDDFEFRAKESAVDYELLGDLLTLKLLPSTQ